MSDLIQLNVFPVKDVLKILLQDKTTKQNIIWATDAYSDSGYQDRDQITMEALLGLDPVRLQPRISKTLAEQQERTRKKAEVMTPVWICNKMNNYADEQWFGRPDVFNHENEDHSWTVTEGPISFSEGKSWKDYVDSRRLEITCGEAPYLVSRYDTTTGELIEPPPRRIGLLDRKLRIVNENTASIDEWMKWAERAFESCYGYEYQGDNLLIARINLLMTYWDYYRDCWGEDPDKKTLAHIAHIIAWNIWQMDGLKDTVPLGKIGPDPEEEGYAPSLFELFPTAMQVEETEKEKVALYCRIYDWRADGTVTFKSCKERG